MAKKVETKKKTNTKTKKETTKKEVKKVVKEEIKKEEKKVVKKEIKEEVKDKKDRGLLFAIIGIVLVVACAIVAFIIPENPDKGKENKVQVMITVKDYGDIVLELDREQAPITVDNFLELANSGFYDGSTFHRVITEFMIQGGAPDGDIQGGSSKTIKGEFEANGVSNNISHTRGTISMARGDEMDSASSQFFICNADSTFLDGYYAAFGHVVSGMEIVDKITKDVGSDDEMELVPEEKRPVIESIRELVSAEEE